MTFKKIPLEKRVCECCGGDEIEAVWSDTSRIRTCNNTCLVVAKVGLCKRCGFCFNSPCPQEEALREFYIDSLPTFSLVAPAYSVDARIEVIKKYAGRSKSFLEIGANDSRLFHSKLSRYFGNLYDIELNRSCKDYQKRKPIFKEGSIDVIAHYDVLEHVPRVSGFLDRCFRLLRPGGIMICEVPDVKLYSRNLMLFSNLHVNHFSVETLTKICGRRGFKLIEIAHSKSSRPFSFLTIFQKTRRALSYNYSPYIEYLETKACILEGIKQVLNYKNQLQALKNKIKSLSDAGRRITLWCATDLLRPLLEDMRFPKGVVIVDSDPLKKDYFEYLGIPVFQHTAYLEHIKRSALLAIFSPRSRAGILDWIKENTGRVFDGDKLYVAGCGVNNEPLQV